MLYIPRPCGCVSTLGAHTLDGPSVCASKCEPYVCTDEHPLMVMESVFCVLSIVSLWTYVFSFFLSHLPSKLMFLSNMSFSKLKTQAAMSVFQQKLSKFRLLGFVVKKCRTFDGPLCGWGSKCFGRPIPNLRLTISSQFWDDMFHIVWWWPIYCLLGDGLRPQSIYGIAAVGGFCNIALSASGQL